VTGVGDYVQAKKYDIKVQDWVQSQLLYCDGRFARDHLWSFFALNYMHRRRNQDHGNWFIKGFLEDAPPTMDDLKERLTDGDTKFLDQMLYYTQKVKGSDAYWRAKRAELYTWINHHIDSGHGAPNLFITLSCAEYFWPDIKRLLEERIFVASGERVDLDSDHTAKVKAVNEYSIVVQEYFHKRVEHFMETVGKELLGIKHYWLRYEFAKSRGQIHCHMLAITHDAVDATGIMSKLYEFRDDKERQARLLDAWVKQRLGMSADMPIVDEETTERYHNEFGDRTQQRYQPCSVRLSDIHDEVLDMFHLANTTQMHKCSDYCMRQPREANKQQSNNATIGNNTDSTRTTENNSTSRARKCRVCRMGAGVERNYGTAETPGWESRNQTEIVHDDRGFMKLMMKRTNNTRMLQTSFDVLRVWRANCDVTVLLYETDPMKPDPAEIAKVTDYVVAYASKGNSTLAVEKELVSRFIMRCVFHLSNES